MLPETQLVWHPRSPTRLLGGEVARIFSHSFRDARDCMDHFRPAYIGDLQWKAAPCWWWREYSVAGVDKYSGGEIVATSSTASGCCGHSGGAGGRGGTGSDEEVVAVAR